ncbi:MAG: hypothetical protein P8N52_08080, partial [Crocinitomicaceae bacterium]|nr:hypothetical protein [Crocinitomicaceae bacterium]
PGVRIPPSPPQKSLVFARLFFYLGRGMRTLVRTETKCSSSNFSFAERFDNPSLSTKRKSSIFMLGFFVGIN